jgi:dTDP-6-deoxy-L-talose 4-dehydrogenase (NAD+)
LQLKKVLVTGATGFLGNYVVGEFLANGYEVIATSSNREKASMADWFSRVRYIPLDLNSLDDNVDYYKFFDQPSFMVHLAWEGLPNYKSEHHVTNNLPKHYLFLKNLIRNGLNHLTVTGTCLEYGMKEGSLSEDMDCFPKVPYGIAKNELRKKLEEYQKVISYDLKWLRLFYMHGRGQSANSILSQLEFALNEEKAFFNMSGGEQVRDYLPVETVADYIVQISSKSEASGIINCCSGIPITIKQLVENYLGSRQKTIKLNLGYYPYPDYEPMQFWGSTNKLKNILHE